MQGGVELGLFGKTTKVLSQRKTCKQIRQITSVGCSFCGNILFEIRASQMLKSKFEIFSYVFSHIGIVPYGLILRFFIDTHIRDKLVDAGLNGTENF